MKKQSFVIDSCVFNKIFLQEKDSQKAMNFFEYTNLNQIKLYAPDFFIYEVINVASFYKVNTNDVYNLIKDYQELNLSIVNPNKKHMEKALEIMNTGHDKSDYLSIYDSIYHSIAIVENFIFVTSDKKHYEKAERFGNIVLLDDVGI